MRNGRPATLWLGRQEFAVFAAYLAMVCVAVSFYAPWEDEGRSWMISRSFGVYTLLFRILRYEGHPFLWYLVLWGPAHLHMSYLCINWISAAIASAGIYVLLRFAPFPFYLRALLPFSFFLAYQYAVVARSYVLFPLLGFLVAHLYRQTRSKPILTAVALGLLANVSVHGTIVASSFAVLYAVKLYREQRSGGLSPRVKRNAVIGAVAGAGVFASSLLFVAVCLWPTQDLVLPEGPASLNWFVYHIRSILPVASTRNASAPVQSVAASTPSNARGLSKAAATSNPSLSSGTPSTGVVGSAAPQPESSVPKASSKTDAGEDAGFKARLARRAGQMPQAMAYGFAAFYPLAFLYDGLLLLYLYRTGKATLIVPAFLLALFLVFGYGNWWHYGLLWITMLMVLWAAWDDPVKPNPLNRQRLTIQNLKLQDLNPLKLNLQTLVAGFLGLLCLLQLPWTFGAIRYEIHHATYPAKAAALYLKTLPSSKRIQGAGFAFTVLPFFPGNIFVNTSSASASAVSTNGSGSRSFHLEAAQPDLLLTDNQSILPGDWSALRSAGYRETHSFCGAQYAPHIYIRPLCLLVFEKR